MRSLRDPTRRSLVSQAKEASLAPAWTDRMGWCTLGVGGGPWGIGGEVAGASAEAAGI